MSLEELKKDSDELAMLLNLTQRQRVKEKIVHLKAEVDKEIVNLEIKAHQMQETPLDRIPKRYLTELTEYAWDQSEKFVKLFITLNGVESIKESNIEMRTTENSMVLTVSDLNGKDYGLTVNNLLHGIDSKRSYHKVKTGMVAVYLKKLNEDEQWDHLTTIQKRIKEKQTKDWKNDPEADTGEDALINIMKKMYNSGDTKTKQMIAKAWTESQEAAHSSYSNHNPL